MTLPDNDYPTTVIEILDDQMRFKPAALRALRAYRASHAWRGAPDERKEKLRQLNRDLATAYGRPEPELIFGELDGTSSGHSSYAPAQHRIVLTGRLSVVTFLHEFAHARGMSERGATRWAVNIFRRVFPRQYSRLVHVGHMLVRPEDIAASVSRGTVR
jgi:hypothetical protein